MATNSGSTKGTNPGGNTIAPGGFRGTNLGNNSVGSHLGGGGFTGTTGGTPGGTVPTGPGSTGTTTPGTPSTGDALLDSLTGAQQDAAAALENLFNSYGLGTLAPKIIGYLKDGFSSDTVSLLLQQTPEYKARFPANDARLKAGLPVLSPAQYISTEDSYRQVLSSAGLPPNFYDSNDDFTNWIAGDVSPTEIQGRVQVASDLVNNADPNTVNAFKQFYTHGDLVAYALDPKTAEPILEKQYQAAQVAGQANANNVTLGQSGAENLAASGVTQAQASQGFGIIGSEQGTVKDLNSIYGQDVSTEDLIDSVFNNNGDATNKINKLASQERGNFGGTTGVGAASLGNRDAGAL